MTPDPEQPQAGSSDRSVFGNLPSARPAVRSPRRDGEKRGAGSAPPKGTQGKAAKAKPPAGAATSRKGASPPPRPPPSPPPPRPGPTGARDEPAPGPSRATESGSTRGGVEEVAWAGITVAAEAATLGVRLVSRALEAVRERR